MVEQGFSPVSFTVESGDSYAVTVADYGSYHFQFWADGYGSSNFISFRPESGEVIDLTAMYETD